MKHAPKECNCSTFDLSHMLIHIDGLRTKEVCMADLSEAIKEVLTRPRENKPPLFEKVNCIAFPLDETQDGFITYYMHQLGVFLKMLERTKYTKHRTLGPGIDLLQRGCSWLMGHVDAVEEIVKKQQELGKGLREKLITALKSSDVQMMKLDRSMLLSFPLTLLQKIASSVGAPVEPLDNATVIVDKILAFVGAPQEGAVN